MTDRNVCPPDFAGLLLALLGIALALVSIAGPARQTLAAAPAKTVPAKAAAAAAPADKKSTAKSLVTAQDIDALIRRLGDKDYFVRQKAQKELGDLGFEAFDALNLATTDKDPEIAFRAKYLLRLMRIEWATANDSAEVKKCLRDYESQDASQREGTMLVLADLPNDEGAAALCRLARFEKSSQLSKMAALALISHGTQDAAPSVAAVDAVRKTLRGCKRPAAIWLLAWSRLGAEPAAVMTAWQSFVTTELDAMRHARDADSQEIVVRLIRFQVAWLKKLGKTDQATAAIRKLVSIERGDPESLAEFTSWLMEQKEWAALEQLRLRFAKSFEQEPDLLYLLAQAYLEQGGKHRAEAAAKLALTLNPGKQADVLVKHLEAAERLAKRGLFDWARREFEHIAVEAGGNPNEVTVLAATQFAELLHDQGQNLDAAAALEPVVKGIDAGRVIETMLPGQRFSDVRSRRFYFLACHWEAKHDRAKQREFLDKGLEACSDDVDVLIACHRLPDQPAEYRTKIAASIKKTAAALHEKIGDDKTDEDSPSASDYNQYAWLVGNTGGDLDEALRCALKSLEYQPDQPAYCDTVAHVYFAKRDYANAVKYEEKAAQGDPHSGLIRTSLERFRKKLDEKK